MMKRSIILLALCLLFDVSAQTQRQLRHPYASDLPIREPKVFAPGSISTDSFESHPAFTRDGRTLYFTRSTPNFNHWTILMSQFKGGNWTTPVVAPFSGQYSDADPFITSDGGQLYFISTRPVEGKPQTGTDIWVMQKSGSTWGEPKNVGAPINSPANEWYPTLAANGTIYFGSEREGGKGRSDIYRSRLVNGKYIEPENLGEAINTPFNEFEPLISPDESFLIFMGGGRPEGHGGGDLYISYNEGGRWSKPINLGDKINSPGTEYSPTISPDGQYFFWTSSRNFAEQPLKRGLSYVELMKLLQSPGNGLGDIYQIDLSALNIRGRSNP